MKQIRTKIDKELMIKINEGKKEIYKKRFGKALTDKTGDKKKKEAWEGKEAEKRGWKDGCKIEAPFQRPNEGQKIL